MDDSRKIAKQTEDILKMAVEHLEQELGRLRTGRASSSLLEGINVEVYGSQMPLKTVATISVPDARLLQITPFDSNNIGAIADSIRNNQSLGLNPSDDGRVIRLAIPPLTEDRRREIAKQIGEKVEEAAIRMRSARHEALKQLEGSKKDKQISEDDARRIEKQVDDLMGVYKTKMEVVAKAKEAEILTL